MNQYIKKAHRKLCLAVAMRINKELEKAQTVCNLMNLAQNKTIWAMAMEKNKNENIA